MKDFLINIKSTQYFPANDNRDSIEMTSVGKLNYDENGYSIVYDESDAIGAGGVKTSLQVLNDSLVILNRSGSVDGRLVVENHKRNSCIYSVPEGTLSIGIYGKSVESDMTENGGRLFLSYTIDAQSNLISENTVEITVKEVKQ
ncbi:MAG: DUF1934 domain-containing protein [Clostridia bacterium]|nr:DUF1934 domain-containing protein [Clostridia bacterium]